MDFLSVQRFHTSVCKMCAYYTLCVKGCFYTLLSNKLKILEKAVILLVKSFLQTSTWWKFAFKRSSKKRLNSSFVKNMQKNMSNMWFLLDQKNTICTRKILFERMNLIKNLHLSICAGAYRSPFVDTREMIGRNNL